MTKTWLVIQEGVVINAVVGDDDTPADWPQATLVDAATTSGAWIGWGYDGVLFHEPAPSAPVVPQTITRLQGRMALFNAGLLTQVENAVAGTGGAIAIWYADAPTWDRGDPILLQFATALKLSAAQVDALFIAAGQIS